MKYLLLCFAVFSIGVNGDLATLQMEEVQRICRNLTRIDQPLIDQARNGQFSEKVKDYYFCYGKNIGYIEFEKIYHFRSIESYYKIDTIDLSVWLVEDLQYDSKTTKNAITSCYQDKPDPDVFEFTKCLSENRLHVDVVSANYVDRSVEDLDELQDYCKNLFNIDQNLIFEAQNGNVFHFDSKRIGSYYVCYLLYGGVLDVYGNISYSYLKNWFKLMLKQNSDKVASAIDRCYKSQVDQGKDVLQIAKCFADENLPLDVMANQ